LRWEDTLRGPIEQLGEEPWSLDLEWQEEDETEDALVGWTRWRLPLPGRL
jgi:hypothetical protein